MYYCREPENNIESIVFRATLNSIEADIFSKVKICIPPFPLYTMPYKYFFIESKKYGIRIPEKEIYIDGRYNYSRTTSIKPCGYRYSNISEFILILVFGNVQLHN